MKKILFLMVAMATIAFSQSFSDAEDKLQKLNEKYGTHFTLIQNDPPSMQTNINLIAKAGLTTTDKNGAATVAKNVDLKSKEAADPYGKLVAIGGKGGDKATTIKLSKKNTNSLVIASSMANANSSPGAFAKYTKPGDAVKIVFTTASA